MELGPFGGVATRAALTSWWVGWASDSMCGLVMSRFMEYHTARCIFLTVDGSWQLRSPSLIEDLQNWIDNRVSWQRIGSFNFVQAEI